MDKTLPLIVDLDGTLIMTDSLHELMVRQLFKDPIRAVFVFLTLLRGRAALKAACTVVPGFNIDTLPLREHFVQWLQCLAGEGRELHLCSAANQNVADAAARRIGVFQSVVGSQHLNLKGRTKAEYLALRFPKGFVYAGDSRADLAVWEQAQGVVLVGASDATERAARALGKPIEAVFGPERPRVIDWLKALRVHHWTKNALIFLPFILGHSWTQPTILPNLLLGFVALLMVVSSTYIINDLIDLESDRAHWSKCHRPIASGRISIVLALMVGITGILTGMAISVMISAAFALTLLSYLVLTLAYSMRLKQVPLLDTAAIGCLFTLRLVMGTTLADQQYSRWLLAFSIFFFFSLAMAKRQTELLRAVSKGATRARGYRVDDIPLLTSFGVGCGVSSLVILCLYLTEDAMQGVIYARPGFLWVAPLSIGIWLGRIWLLAHRGEMRDDPVSFAVHDCFSVGLSMIIMLAFLLAL